MTVLNSNLKDAPSFWDFSKPSMETFPGERGSGLESQEAPSLGTRPVCLQATWTGKVLFSINGLWNRSVQVI